MKKRADGRIQKKVYVGLENGVKKYRYVYGYSKKEVEMKAAELKTQLGKGIDIIGARNSFGFWLERWIQYKQSTVSESWMSVIRTNAKRLAPMAAVPIGSVTVLDVSEVLNDMAHECKAKRTIKAVRDIANGVMRLAVQARVIEYNPISCMELPRAEPAVERETITEEQQAWVRNTPHRAQTAAMIMLYAGLRRGELIPLQWTDIDLTEKTISVTKSVEMINGKPSQKKGGKTYYAKRTIAIPQLLVDYLKEQPKTSFLVCPTAKGQMHGNTSWRRLWESYMSVLNFKYGDFSNVIVDGKPLPMPSSRFQPGGVPMVIDTFTAHQLRHTYVTLLYLAGVDLLTAKEQAGHKSIQVTADIYTHLDRIYKNREVVKLDEYLTRSSTEGCQRGVN